MTPTFVMPFAQQMRLCENAVTLAAPGVGLRTGSQLQLAAHGSLGTAMQTSQDLGTAVSTFAEFLDTRASFYTTSLQLENDAAHFTIAIDHLPPTLVPFFTEAILQTLGHCIAFFTGSVQESQAEISINYAAPEYEQAYREVFGHQVSFNAATTAIRLPAAKLELGSPEADANAYGDSVQRCRKQIRELQEGDLQHNIETFLINNPGKLWSLDEIAPLFALSGRTIIRRLKSSGTTYQEIRDQILKQQALSCLGSMSVEATAMTLGFSEASSFRRAYKRWFGEAPRS